MTAVQSPPESDPGDGEGFLRTPGCSNPVSSASQQPLSCRNVSKHVIQQQLILRYIFCTRSNQLAVSWKAPIYPRPRAPCLVLMV